MATTQTVVSETSTAVDDKTPTSENKKGMSSKQETKPSTSQPHPLANKQVYLRFDFGGLLTRNFQEEELPYFTIKLSRLFKKDGHDSYVLRSKWFYDCLLPHVGRNLDAFCAEWSLDPLGADIVGLYHSEDYTKYLAACDTYVLFSPVDERLERLNANGLARCLLRFAESVRSSCTY